MFLTGSEGGVEVIESPREDHNVVDIEPAGHHRRSNPNSFEDRGDLEDTEAADGKKLADRDLQHEHRHPGEDQGQRIRNQEGT